MRSNVRAREKERKKEQEYLFGVQIEKETQWHSTVNFFTGKYAPSTIHTHLKHNFIGWHATVVNDKGIDTLDSMMFRLFIFMCVRSYLQRLCCGCRWCRHRCCCCCWLFSSFPSLAHSFLHNTRSYTVHTYTHTHTNMHTLVWFAWQTNRKISYQWLFHPEMFRIDLVFVMPSLLIVVNKTATTSNS